MSGAAPARPPARPAEPTRLRHRWFAWLWLVVVLGSVAHNGWVWFVEKRTPETDILALLPASERDPAVNKAMAAVTEAAQQRVVVLVGHRNWGDARRAAAAYRGVLDRYGQWFRPDRTPVMDRAEALAPWWARRSALLTADDRRALDRGVPDQWTESALQNLSSPLGVGRVGAWQDDPFGLFRHWVQARAAETPVRPADGVLRVADSTLVYVLLPVTLAAEAFSLTAQQAVVPVLEEARAAALHAAPGSRVLTAGVILFAAAAANQANTEVSIIGWGSLAGIVVLMWFTFRSPLPIGLVVLSLAVGTLGALSVSALLFDKLHLITLVFGASLVGVAEDYGIHYLCQRIGDRRDPWVVMRELLPGLAFALLTTGVAYLGLALTPFPGLRQMAVFSAAGLVFAWLTVIVWFPQLERSASRETRFSAWLGATRERWPTLRRDRRTAAVLVVTAIVIVAGLARVTTDDDIRLLNFTPPALVAEQREVGRILRAPAPSQFFLLRAADDEALLVREEALRVRLDSLVARGVLTGYQATSAWVPSLATQARDQALIAGLYATGGPLDRLGAALGERTAWAQATRARLTTPANGLTVTDWLANPVAGPYRHLWLGAVDRQRASVVALQGVDAGDLAQLRAVAGVVPGVTWVDKVADVSALMGRHRRQMTGVVIVSFALLWVLLLPRYGRRAWRVLAPTVIGILLALAACGLAGQPLQLFHILALLLILGMGVDYGIFLEEHPGQHDHKAWLAVALSAASTLLSFGLLGVSATPALRTFGITMLLGIGVVTLIAPCFCTSRAVGA